MSYPYIPAPAGSRIRKNRKLPLLIFKKKSKISGGGDICAPSAKHGKSPHYLCYYCWESDIAAVGTTFNVCIYGAVWAEYQASGPIQSIESKVEHQVL